MKVLRYKISISATTELSCGKTMMMKCLNELLDYIHNNLLVAGITKISSRIIFKANAKLKENVREVRT
jgi:ABC-type phosphate transport system ATPase subunit